MVSSDLRSVGVVVFRLLSKRPKSLAPLARAVHAAFGLKYGLETLTPSDHPDTTPAEFKWRIALARIKSDAEIEISRMPSEPGARGAHLHFLRFRILDQIAAAAKEMRDLKTSAAVSTIRVRESNRLDTAMTIDRVTRPSQDFTE